MENMADYTSNLASSRPRPDGMGKVTGGLNYLTDLQVPNMLYGKVLRSEYPHAKIQQINIEKAEQLSGVLAVITSKDVPGLNGFGLITQDQPVFCDQVVRYIGDAVAAVAAITPEIAAKALKRIEVIYEPLPIIDDPNDAMNPDSIPLHLGGNILHEASYENGDVDEGFQLCEVIIEETYLLPRQMHAYMETEGGVFVPEKDGRLSVYAGTQHGYKDRLQLARILNLPEERIRVISSPMGGSFGGKDELNIQPYGAILALKTGRPVKIHQSRRESMISGIKKHPMKITMKTGAKKTGEIVAHEVRIIADTGAYATLGPAVLDFAVEHAIGPYAIPNVKTKGYSVFTNNGVAGEFRGFGGNQITFALEGQIDRLADGLHMSPLVLRKKNLRQGTDPGPVGQIIAPTNGDALVLDEIAQSPLLAIDKSENDNPWKKTGVGLALTMHGGGLGFGRLDPSGGKISLNHEGKIEIAFGFEEVGQGLLAVIENVTTEAIGCSSEDLHIVIGDTDKVPHSGSSTASRGTSMIWHSLQRLKGPFIEKLLDTAAKISGYQKEQLYVGGKGIWLNGQRILTFEQLFLENEPISIDTKFDFPTTPNSIPGGHFLYSFAAVAVKVEVDLITGAIKVTDIDQAVSAGPVVNPTGYIGQIEGGTIMALGYTLLEEAAMKQSRYTAENFDTYILPTIQDIPPKMNVRAIEDLWKGDIYGPRGVGEIGTVALAPAIVRAIYDATGHWVTKLPVSREEILHAGERVF